MIDEIDLRKQARGGAIITRNKKATSGPVKQRLRRVNRVTLFIHGYNNDRRAGIQIARGLAKDVQQRLSNPAPNWMLSTVLWPGDWSALSLLSFPFRVDTARAAGRKLRFIVRSHVPQGTTIDLVAISLGNEVALTAAAAIVADHRLQMGRLISLCSASSASGLAPSNAPVADRYPTLLPAGTDVTVISSTNDLLLSDKGQFGGYPTWARAVRHHLAPNEQLLPALGYAGPLTESGADLSAPTLTHIKLGLPPFDQTHHRLDHLDYHRDAKSGQWRSMDHQQKGEFIADQVAAAL